ncbi:MAG: flagellar hook-associated protein 3 [Lachnospiraceae bacterium]|jgi:flagellar hook-associated protein 3 FlgL|nr:flagellar hook-associated protein 3 [Lachnospiraceae bacterium]
MRVTNKMMTNNMMSNINKNKEYMSILEQQYSTGKKIQRPSEDPIVAVRALKLRTNLAELEQYHEKNIPDAMSWMDVTETALTTVHDLLHDINTYCVQGSSDQLQPSDRLDIVQNLEQLKQQIYHEGNSSYAGRYVFTGYKTDSSLLFDRKRTDLSYRITEKITGNQIEFGRAVAGGYEMADYDDIAEDFADAPQLVEYRRIQLSYDTLDTSATPPAEVSYTQGGVTKDLTGKITVVSATEDNPYEPDPDKINYIPETGELILGANIYKEMKNADQIDINYTKSSFKEGDLKPEHYFDCVLKDPEKPEEITFTRPEIKQEIRYEVNYNQKLTVNTEGAEAFAHKMGRDIDEILNAVNDVIASENKIAEVKERLKDTDLTTEERAKYEKMLEQLDTEYVLKKEVMQDAFSNGITTSYNEKDRVNTALADLGSRYVRLKLTDDRLGSQKTDFEDLMSQNEDVNLVDTIIRYGSADMIYNASLSAAARAVQNNLLDFLR